MRIIDYKHKNLENELLGKKIVIFGAGVWLHMLECSLMEPFSDQIEYIIDNKVSGTETVFGKEYPIYKPEAVIKEEECVIILTSPIFMYEMFIQLDGMNLGNSISCMAFPFFVNNTDSVANDSLLEKILNKKDKEKIPKVIHSFWFSGEKKPDNYQRCIDSWYEKCPDYKIIEWTQDNYDCKKHPFLRRAIELKMWAFATDYARLDIIYNNGGIYLDMDVEIIKPFDDLLDQHAVFPFRDICAIDTAIFMAEPKNAVVYDLLHLYDGVNLPTEREQFKAFFPLTFEKKAFQNAGVRFDGSSQILEHMTAAAPSFFMPLNTVTFDEPEITPHTYTIHYDNFGWSTGKENKRNKKIRDNRHLKDIMDEILQKERGISEAE